MIKIVEKGKIRVISRRERRETTLVITLISLLVILIGIFMWQVFRSQDSHAIDTFSECVEAGNPVMESYPRQCRTDSGSLFIERLDQSR